MDLLWDALSHTFGVGEYAMLCQLGTVLSTLGVSAFKAFDMLL